MASAEGRVITMSVRVRHRIFEMCVDAWWWGERSEEGRACTRMRTGEHTKEKRG